MQKEKMVGRQCVGAQIADILEERILQNIYPVGGKLPPERQLAEEFCVSRQSLRAALRILSARGMLYARQGDGHYVSARVNQAFQLGWEEVAGRHDMADEVLDFRRSVEGLLAGFAAQRRTEADLQRLRYWLAELESAYGQHDSERQAAADAAFHQVVAESAHNVMFTRLSESLLRLLKGHTRRNLANMFAADRYAQLSEQHEAIFRAIERQDASAAQRAAEAHLDYVRRSLHDDAERAAREAVSAALAENDVQGVFVETVAGGGK